MKYVNGFDNGVISNWKIDDVPVHVRVGLAELEWIWKTLVSTKLAAQDCRSPHGKFIRERATGADGLVDPGNMVYDAMVNLLRMWRAVDVLHYGQVIKVAGKEYGQRGNMSSSGPVNFRGNIVESLLRWTQLNASPRNHPRPHEIKSCQQHYLGWW